MINRVFPPTRGATGRLLLELSSALSGEGYDVTVLTTGDKPDTKREMYGIEIIRVQAPRNPRSVFANFIVSMRLFFKALSLQKPDVIVTKTDPPLFVIFGVWLALLKRTKHIHWCQDLYPDILHAFNYPILKPVYKILDFFTCRALRSCNKVIAIGTCMKQALQRKGVKSNNITIIPNWHDYVVVKNIDAASQDENLPQKFRVLYAGTMNKGHPYQTILDAAEILNETEQDIEFLFVGNSLAMHRLAKERARKGLDNVRFLPYQPRRRLKALLESGDLHIVSMADEALGCMVPSRIYDIFAVKRPCLFVGPEECELAVMLEKHEAGLTIPQGKPEMLANAVRHLRDNGEDWETLYEGSIQASKIYTPQRCLELWQNLLKNI